jgi:hypothetical protein
VKRFPLAAALSAAFATVGLATMPTALAQSTQDTAEMDTLLQQAQQVDNFYAAYFPDAAIRPQGRGDLPRCAARIELEGRLRCCSSTTTMSPG